MSTTRRKRSYLPFLIPGLTLLVVLVLAPYVFNLIASLTRWNGVGPMEYRGFENYARVFSDARFWTSLKNNGLFILAMTVIPTLLSLALSLLIYEIVFREVSPALGSTFQLGFYLPQIITIAASSLAWRWIYSPNDGALNVFLETIGLESLTRNWLGTVQTAMPAVMALLVWYQIGYSVVIFISALQRINPELYESAVIDGASRTRIFASISVPHMIAEIHIVTLTTLVHALKVFDPVYAMTGGGPGFSTSVVSYYSYRSMFQTMRVGYGSAISNVLSFAIFLIIALYVGKVIRMEK